MKVQFVLDSISIGGIPRNVFRLICGLQDQLTDYRVCSMHAVHEGLEDLGICDEAKVMFPSRKGRLAQYRHIERCLKDFNADAVSTHGYVSQFFLACHKWRSGHRPACVAFMHGLLFAMSKSWRIRVYWQLYRLALREADLIVCVSEDTRRRLIKCGFAEERLLTVPNSIPEGSSVRTPRPRRGSEPMVLGYLGRLHEGKRVDAIIRAVAWAVNRGHDIHLRVAGTGDHRETLQELADALGLGRRVEFRGYVRDPLAFLSECHCLVLLSESEGMPQCLLEAAAAGVPVIANRVGGIPEVVCDRQGGILVDTVAADIVGSAIAELATSEDLRMSMARSQLFLAQHSFSSEERSQSVLNAYQLAVSRWRQSR